MAIEQLDVQEIVDRAVSKRVDIPEFQREFVWSPQDVALLAESLYRDYPIGSFLLWDSSEYQEPKTAQGTQASLWIVDGQQRTTALCLLFGKRPYWWPDAESWNKALKRYDVVVNLLPDEELQVSFGLPNPIRRRDPRWVSVRRVLSIKEDEKLTEMAQEITKAIEQQTGQQNLFSKIHARLHRLWKIRERQVPIITVKHEVEDVAEIFSRLNQAGTRVKEADVILAVAAVRNPGWVREEYLPYRTDLEERGWDLDAGIFIRTMTAIGLGKARLKEVPPHFWDPGSMRSVWKETSETIATVIKQLAENGVLSGDLLPSTNSLIPLFALHSKWKGSSDYSFSKALWWFLMANRAGRYSGAAITTLNEDVQTIVKAPSFHEAIEQLSRRLDIDFEINDGEFLNRYDRAGSRFLRLMLFLLLFNHGATDWVDGTRLGYDNTGSPITKGYRPQWHHIYPRNLLRRSGRVDDDIHALANITVLNERTNVNRLAGKAPWDYIAQYSITADRLRRHFIPEVFAQASDEGNLEEAWDIERYDHFLIERATLLARAANEWLSQLHNG